MRTVKNNLETIFFLLTLKLNKTLKKFQQIWTPWKAIHLCIILRKSEKVCFLPKSVLLLFSWHCPFNLSSYFSRDIVPLNRILLLLEAKAWVVTQLYARPLKLFMGVIKLRELIRPYIRIYNLIYFSRFFHTALQNKAVFKWHMQRIFFLQISLVKNSYQHSVL